MRYRTELRSEAVNDLARLDKIVAKRILKKITWLADNFENINPEALRGDLKSLFKLRIGSYRAIYSINHSEELISIHLVGHRKEIYKP